MPAQKRPPKMTTLIILQVVHSQVMKASPYLELTSGQTSHTYQLFVEKDPKIKIPTVQVRFLNISYASYFIEFSIKQL